MGHDVEAYNVVAGHRSPADTKTAELAQQEVARNEYQRDTRNGYRQYAAMVGQPDAYVPVLSSISPTTAAGAAAPFTLTATGSNFNEDSKIIWSEGPSTLSTVYVSPTTLTAYLGTLNSWFPGAPRTVQISVKTDSSTSTTKPFTIT